MPSVNKLSFLEHNNITYKQKSDAKQTQKIGRQSRSDVDENRGGVDFTFPTPCEG